MHHQKSCKIPPTYIAAIKNAGEEMKKKNCTHHLLLTPRSSDTAHNKISVNGFHPTINPARSKQSKHVTMLFQLDNFLIRNPFFRFKCIEIGAALENFSRSEQNC